MAERVKFEVDTARQLFLYGAGDGKRVINAQALADQTGLHIATIHKYMKTWLVEAEELLAGASNSGLALKLSKETMVFHNDNMKHLEKQIKIVKYEIDTLDVITEKLESWLDKFDQTDEMETAIRIFHDWQRACGTKASLRSQFLAMQKQHATLSGIVDLKDVEVVRAKEISKGKAKLEMQKLAQQEAANGGEIRNATPMGFFENSLGE
jgi:hypothetical protein